MEKYINVAMYFNAALQGYAQHVGKKSSLGQYEHEYQP